MNKLIKGNLMMNNVADKDVNMYVKAGWKLEQKPKKKSAKELKKELCTLDEFKLVENEDNNISNIIEE